MVVKGPGSFLMLDFSSFFWWRRLRSLPLKLFLVLCSLFFRAKGTPLLVSREVAVTETWDSPWARLLESQRLKEATPKENSTSLDSRVVEMTSQEIYSYIITIEISPQKIHAMRSCYIQKPLLKL